MNKPSVFKYLAASALLTAASGALASPRFPIEVSRTAVSSDGAELELAFRDREPVRNACDFHVSRFEYVAAAELLVVDLLSRVPCPLDRYGRRTGSLKWVLPSALRGSSKVTVVLNGLKIGEVTVRGAEAEFNPILF